MRTRIGILIGLVLSGMWGLPHAAAVNILVREVRREREADGLTVVYELHNASVDRWDLRRVEIHVFDRLGRRLTLLRPRPTITRLERDDIELIRGRIPPALLPEAHRLELRILLEEVTRFPVADPVPERLVFSFPLKPRRRPRLLRAAPGTLRVESAGMVQSSRGPRTILLRVINQGSETLSEIVLVGEIRGTQGTLQQLFLPPIPGAIRPGGEVYTSLAVPMSIVTRAEGISLRALYRKPERSKRARYVEALKIQTARVHPDRQGWERKSAKGSL